MVSTCGGGGSVGLTITMSRAGTVAGGATTYSRAGVGWATTTSFAGFSTTTVRRAHPPTVAAAHAAQQRHFDFVFNNMLSALLEVAGSLSTLVVRPARAGPVNR